MPGEETLQRISIDAGIAELMRGAGSRGEALDNHPALLGGLAHGFERRGFSHAGASLQALDSVARGQNLFRRRALRGIENRILGGMRHGLLNRHDLVGPALPLAHLPQDFLLSMDGFRRGELPRGTVLRRGDKLKFAGGQTLFDAGANLGVGGFAHAAPQGIAEEGALIGDSLALEAAFAGKGHCFLGGLLRFLRSALGRFLLATLAGRGHNLIRLIAELGGQLAVRREHLGGRLNLLLVARGVGGDLRRLVAGETILLHVCEDLILALA